MEMAFVEAENARGKTLPNPPVGAVLVKNGRVIAKGGTRPAGQAHAEIVALEKARGHAEGATLYVTLEPCCHQGKTPPCTRALIAARVKRVVAACSDPNPKVSGKGFAELRRAGIEVQTGLLEERALEFYESFSFFIKQGRPKIILKVAQSLDGRINERPGLETEITGVGSRRFAHALRAGVDAILIGGGTLRSDNPFLTPRLVSGPTPEALVLTHGKNLNRHFHLFSKNRGACTSILTPVKTNLPSHVQQISFKPKKGDAAMAQALLKVFREKGYHSVLVEGGRSVWTPFLNSGLWDAFYLFTSPKFLPMGERWDRNLRSGWVKTLEFHRFTALGPDVLAEFRQA